MTTISGSIVVRENQILRNASISFEAGSITGISSKSTTSTQFNNSMILPGFIDLHTHGHLGKDTADIDEDLLLKYAQTGTTSFLPTYGCGSFDDMMNWLDTCKALQQQATPGIAEIIGCHLEGPFIDPSNCGGINIESCIEPCEETLEAFTSHTALKYMTVSPFVPGALDAIKRLTTAGIICVSGHSRGSANLFEQAHAAGIKGICHYYNNNANINDFTKEPGVRNPTLCDSALLYDDVFLEIICDLQHVDPMFIQLALKIKGPRRIAVISDSISGSGLPDGIHEYHDGRKYEIKDGGAHECETGGRFGSCVTQVDEFANLVDKLNVSCCDAARMCALTPAEILGVADRKGSLEQGKDADLLVIDRDTFEIQAVFVKGERVNI